MAHERMEMQGFLDEIRQVTKGTHPRKFCFVLGAGASRSSGIKTGQQLVDIWEGELTKRNPVSHEEWKQENGITEENKYSFYSQYYDRRFGRNPKDGFNFMEKMMGEAKPSAGYVILSYLLKNPFHNVVVTTNFDHLAEDAVNYYAQTIPQVIGHEALAHYVSREINRPTIVKIHRDLLLDPRSRPKELETLHDNWKKALADIFSVYSPVFIGYAGNDRSLMDFLKDNSAKFKSGEWQVPYWMLYKTDKLAGDVLSFVDATDGYVIWHGGFDETMYLIGNELGYKMPSEEAFLQDAKDRYKSLSDAIMNYSGNIENLLFPGKSRDSAPKGSEKQDSEPQKPGGDSGAISRAIQNITEQADPNDARKMYLDYMSLLSNEKYEEAIGIIQKLVSLEPDNALYQFSLGVTLYEMGRYEEALEAAQKAVSLEPDDAWYQYSLGVTLHEMGRYEEALEAKQKAVSLEPDNGLYQNSLGVTLNDMERYEEALEAEEKAVKLEPDNARYQRELGNTLNNMGRYEEALEAAQKAVSLEPDNGLYQNGLGVTLHAMGRYAEALVAKQKAVSLEPDNGLYQYSLGVTLNDMERYEEALEAEQKAVRLEPDNARYQNSLGVTLHEMGRYEEALEAKQKAVALEPDNARYQYSLGVTLHEMGRYEEALEAEQKAVRLEPDNARYQNSLGVTLHKMGRYEEALEAKQKAVSLEPDNARYQNSLGVTLHEMGRYEEAIKAFQKAVKLAPDEKEYQEDLKAAQKKAKPNFFERLFS